MRANEMMMPPARGIAPPLKPVPAPRPTMATLCSFAVFTMKTTSVGCAGKHDNSGDAGPRRRHRHRA